MFHRSQINAYAKIMTAYATRAASTWHDGQILDIHGEMMKLTMSIVAKCLFDSDIESESESIARDLTTTIEYFNRLSSPPLQSSPKPADQQEVREGNQTN